MFIKIEYGLSISCFFRNEVKGRIHNYHGLLRRNDAGQEVEHDDQSNDSEADDSTGDLPPEPGLRSVAELGEVAKVLFPRFTWFNKVQSQVLDCCYYSHRYDYYCMQTSLEMDF